MEECEHHIGSRKQASDFEVTTKSIINHVQEIFDAGEDIAEALRMMNGSSMTEWRLTLSVSTSEDEVTRDRESRKFKLDCKGELADHRERMRE